MPVYNVWQPHPLKDCVAYDLTHSREWQQRTSMLLSVLIVKSEYIAQYQNVCYPVALSVSAAHLPN